MSQVTLYESGFHKIIWHPSEGYLEDLWTPQTEMMNPEQYKQEMIQYRDMVEKYEAPKALITLVEFYFPSAPDIQTWVDNNVMIVTKKYIKKAAFVMPKELVAQLSVEQINQGENTPQEAIKYFDNNTTALSWLLA